MRVLNLKDIPIKKIPDSEGQVALLLEALLCYKYKSHVHYIDLIAQYSHQPKTDLICCDKMENCYW